MQFRCEIWSIKRSRFSISFFVSHRYDTEFTSGITPVTTFIHHMMASKVAMDKNQAIEKFCVTSSTES